MFQNRDEILAFLREIVEINSASSNPDGVNRVQALVQEKLQELGFKTRLVPHPDPKARAGNFLIGELIPAGMENLPGVTLISHADTVFSPQSPFQKFSLSPDGSKAFGPGIIDDKGGILVALLGCKKLLEKQGNSPAFPIRFVCTPTEEIGSPGFHPLLQELSLKTFLVLGLEPSQDDGSIVASRRGNRWYWIQTRGREAHAGRAHAFGVNAAHELVVKLDRIQRLTDYDKDLTVSIGSIHTPSDKFNIVCGEAEARIDARFSDFEGRDSLHRRITEILDEKIVRSPIDQAAASTRVEIYDDCPPVAPNPHASAWIDSYLSIIENIESRRVQATRANGSADCNYMNRPGLAIIDGLGPTGGGLHTESEFLVVESLETRSEALARFLSALKRA